jgi:hypothetical protein
VWYAVWYEQTVLATAADKKAAEWMQAEQWVNEQNEQWTLARLRPRPPPTKINVIGSRRTRERSTSRVPGTHPSSPSAKNTKQKLVQREQPAKMPSFTGSNGQRQHKALMWKEGTRSQRVHNA